MHSRLLKIDEISFKTGRLSLFASYFWVNKSANVLQSAYPDSKKIASNAALHTPKFSHPFSPDAKRLSAKSEKFIYKLMNSSWDNWFCCTNPQATSKVAWINWGGVFSFSNSYALIKLSNPAFNILISPLEYFTWAIPFFPRTYPSRLFFAMYWRRRSKSIINVSTYSFFFVFLIMYSIISSPRI